jgi:hypothetical protein
MYVCLSDVTACLCTLCHATAQIRDFTLGESFYESLFRGLELAWTGRAEETEWLLLQVCAVLWVWVWVWGVGCGCMCDPACAHDQCSTACTDI